MYIYTYLFQIKLANPNEKSNSTYFIFFNSFETPPEPSYLYTESCSYQTYYNRLIWLRLMMSHIVLIRLINTHNETIKKLEI